MGVPKNFWETRSRIDMGTKMFCIPKVVISGKMTAFGPVETLWSRKGYLIFDNVISKVSVQEKACYQRNI